MARRVWTTRLVLVLGVALLMGSVVSAAARSSVTMAMPGLPSLNNTLQLMTVHTVAAQQVVAAPQPAALLTDNFAADPVGANPPAGWMIADGRWEGVVTDTRHVLRHARGAYGHIVAGSAAWMNYSVGAAIRPSGLATGFAAVVARYRDRGNYYGCGIYGLNTVRLWLMRAGVATTLDERQAPMSTAVFHDVQLVVDGARLSCVVDGRYLLGASDGSFRSGRVGLVAATGDTSEFTDVRVVG